MDIDHFQRLPEEVRREIFKYLSVEDYLQLDSVSSIWRGYVELALQEETRFCSVRFAKGQGKLNSCYVERLLIRMCNPSTGFTKLKYLNLQNVGGADFGHFSSDVDFYFPNLETLILGEVKALPRFAFNCVRLRRFECEYISHTAIVAVLTAFPNLRVFKPPKIEGVFLLRDMPFSTPYSWEATAISFLNDEPRIPFPPSRVVFEAFPNLTELSLTILTENDRDYRPVSRLRLRRFSLKVRHCREIESREDSMLNDFFEHSPPLLPSNANLSEALEEFKLSWGHDKESPDNEDNLRLISGCPHLRKLSLHCIGLPFITDSFDIDFLCRYLTSNHFPALEELRLPSFLPKDIPINKIQLPNLERLELIGEDREPLKYVTDVTRTFPALSFYRIGGLRLDKELFYQFAECLRRDRASPLEIGIDRLCTESPVSSPSSSWTSSCDSYLRSLHLEAGSLGLTYLKFSFRTRFSMRFSPELEANHFCVCDDLRRRYEITDKARAIAKLQAFDKSINDDSPSARWGHSRSDPMTLRRLLQTSDLNPEIRLLG